MTPATWPRGIEGAIGEIRATLGAQGIVSGGHPGGIYASELFSRERGEATLFVPVGGEVRRVGRVVPFVAPQAELAVITHTGSHSDVDRSYGALATYVSERALAVDGPVREYYLVGRQDTGDEKAWRTEIGWPIFDVGPGDGRA